MAEIHWLNPVSADFNTATDWSTGTVSGYHDVAYLDAAGTTPYTVATSTSETVLGVQLAKTATLAITGGTFRTIFDGSLGCTNAGTIAIGNAATFSSLGGTIVNTGTIALGSTGAATVLAFSDGPTLTGGGTISLSDNSENIIEGPKRGVITNLDNTIIGSGTVTGAGILNMTNGAGGVIDADNKTPLTIKVSGLANAGLIEATGKGHCVIIAGLNNTGTLEANGGTLTVKDGVGGAGSAVIKAGTIDFQDAFTQAVNFTGRSGKLKLAKSQTYTASITGFSLTGKTSLDLGGIAFVSSTEATFSGTATSGVLAVTDGTHFANIHLTGNYTAASFIASGDGNGGTIVVGSNMPPAPPAHRFIAAAAGLAGSAGEAIHVGARVANPVPMLAGPHAMVA